MTYSNDRLEDYINQGQQDDRFNEDLTIAGHAPQESSSTVNDEYLNQGQQDDYFDEDLSSGDRLTQ